MKGVRTKQQRWALRIAAVAWLSASSVHAQTAGEQAAGAVAPDVAAAAQAFQEAQKAQLSGDFARAAELAPHWENAMHALRGTRHVIDVRTIGLVAGIELEPRAGAVGARAFETFVRCFEQGLLVRVTGDVIALSPPLIVSREQIDEMAARVRSVLSTID